MNKTKVGSGSKDVKQLFLSQLNPLQKLIQKVDAFFNQETKMIFIGDHQDNKVGLNFTFFTYMDKLADYKFK